MSKWVVDILGEIEGDYDIIKKYEEPKTGHWIDCKVLNEVKCSSCRMCFEQQSNYCPNCGAKMESESNNE